MEVEKADAQITKRALQFAQAHKLAVVSTVAPNGVPESAMMLFSIDDNFDFYFITRNDSRKVQNLQTNKNVSVVIGTELSPSTLQMTGIALAVPPKEQKAFVEKLQKNSDLNALYYGPFLNIAGINFTLYKVTMSWARWLALDLGNLKEAYYQII